MSWPFCVGRFCRWENNPAGPDWPRRLKNGFLGLESCIKDLGISCPEGPDPIENALGRSNLIIFGLGGSDFINCGMEF